MLDRLLAKPYPHAIGHYLIDLPTAFEPDQGMFLRFPGENEAILESKQQYLPPFNQQMQRYEQELRKTVPHNKINGDYLKRIYPLPVGVVGQVFERIQSRGTPDVARTLEAYRWDKDVTFKMEVKADDGSAPRYDARRKILPDLYENTVP